MSNLTFDEKDGDFQSNHRNTLYTRNTGSNVTSCNSIYKNWASGLLLTNSMEFAGISFHESGR